MDKNSLSSIKKRDTNILEVAHKKEIAANKKVGRKAKPLNEKESKPVTIKITEIELENLKKNAGLVPLGTFLKDYIRTKTELLK